MEIGLTYTQCAIGSPFATAPGDSFSTETGQKVVGGMVASLRPAGPASSLSREPFVTVQNRKCAQLPPLWGQSGAHCFNFSMSGTYMHTNGEQMAILAHCDIESSF